MPKTLFLMLVQHRPPIVAASSECGYTKATSDTCISFKKTLNYCTVIAVGAI